jgi:hypothetical protein
VQKGGFEGNVTDICYILGLRTVSEPLLTGKRGQLLRIKGTYFGLVLIFLKMVL